MYRRILVGVDGSAASERGLQEALRLAADGAQLRVVHVLGELALMAGVPEAAYLGAVLAEARRGGEQVVAKARAAAEAAGVTAEASCWRRSAARSATCSPTTRRAGART